MRRGWERGGEQSRTWFGSLIGAGDFEGHGRVEGDGRGKGGRARLISQVSLIHSNPLLHPIIIYNLISKVKLLRPP